MNQRDQWTERLRCRSCGTDDRAILSQASPSSAAYHDGTDQNVRADLVPVDFRSVVTEFGCDFYCAKCGALADYG